MFLTTLRNSTTLSETPKEKESLLNTFNIVVCQYDCNDAVIRYCDVSAAKLFMEVCDSRGHVIEPSYLYQALRSFDEGKIDYFLSRPDAEGILNKYGWIVQRAFRDKGPMYKDVPSNIREKVSVKYVINK